MRIAILAHARHPIASPFAGGMEAYCWHLAEGLLSRGHEVTLFASGDSDKRFTLQAVIPVHHELSFPGLEHRGHAALKAHIDAGYASACDRIAERDFDVLHNNSLSRFPLEGRRTQVVPTLTSLHVPPYAALQGFVHESPGPKHRITATSQAHLHAWWPHDPPPEASVLYNGIDPHAWPYQHSGDGSAVWSGRFTSSKGADLAIAAANCAGIPLTLFGPIEEREYWEARIAPHLRDSIRYGGHLSASALSKEVGRASVFLFTPRWNEPFGLAAIEAMSCGLPVAGIARGAAEEVIGEAGCLTRQENPVTLATMINNAANIPRDVPRNRVLRLFTRERWLEQCETIYSSLLL